MERKVYSTETVLVTQDYNPDNEINLIRKVNYLITKGKGLLAESISGKTEFRPWLTEVENIVKEAENLENKSSGRDFRGKMKELDELYRKGKLAESLVAEEDAGETSQGKLAESLVAEENSGETSQTKKENSSGEDNEGGKKTVVGMGGVGKVRIENKEAVDMKFGEILVAEENAGEKRQSSSQSKTKRKNSSGEANERGKKTVVGMGGVGDTRIENKGAVNMTFGNISI